MEKTLRDLRQNKYGKSPNTVEEIKNAFETESIKDGLGRSLYGQKRTLFKQIQIEKNFSNCIFASEASIALIEQNLDPSERFFIMDGTFRITPQGVFSQVLVLYIRFGLKVRFGLTYNKI